ncbi:phosphatidylserine decarboxylase family protein [Carboxydothermus ferrireducens]|uniref:Phosphatidylserine decarboxylase proenzyme n=1 Tax=Carboxydothermus ferrireducens DSM 11255 TaxID=1119529 RepID=A0ABX2R6M9_9THEO|nr:phosphatidylserine decarboxylase family protein [Carboxydothermus ferrireducens]NYE56826.1 phosphatidylserine decarboxylase [Carboxydothermus ferrireducens DSM 11255]
MKEPLVMYREGFWYLVALGVLTVLGALINFWLGLLVFLLFLFVVFFFRNPRRTIPEDEKAIISPADGVVLDVAEVNASHYLKGPAVKISIFLSIFDVHVNRAPVEGRVEYVYYREGKFLPAFKSHASEINERNYIGIKNPYLQVLVVQITGFIARRIVSYVKPGDILKKGQLLGMIKFGSCTEIYLPKETVEVLVQKGQRVYGGITVIGRIKG